MQLRPNAVWWGVAAGILAALAAGVASAQHITIDGKLSPAQTLTGPSYTIGANLGRQVGGNLFQSFGLFGLTTGESANFTGPGTVANVIGRVTGGTLSSINGTVQSSIPKANLYLINPSGIVFGPNATVNVTGSFHASTADYLKMSDGAKFQATNPSGSTLSAAPPTAFGFLNATPPAITVNGSTLSVPTGQTLGLVAGPISIAGATLTAPAGTIHVTGVAGPGEVPTASGAGGPTVAAHGAVSITGGSLLDVSDPSGLGSGGSIFIHSDTLTIDGSSLVADNFGPGPGGRLGLFADTSLAIRNDSLVESSSNGRGRGANLMISAPTILLSNSIVGSGANAAGDAGDISFVANTMSIAPSGAIITVTTAGGAAGTVSLNIGGALKIVGDGVNFTGIGADSDDLATGSAGNIEISAGKVVIANGAQINSDTLAFGNGGRITIAADRLVVDQGEISALTQSVGRGSDIDINAGKILVRSGPLGQGITSGSLPFDGTCCSDTGDAGSITITADRFTIVNPYVALGGVLSNTGGPGAAGPITINAQRLTLNGGDISAGTSTTGAGGKITINAARIKVFGEAEIVNDTIGSGNAGDIAITATDRLLVDSSAISSSSDGGSGHAGTISIGTGTFVLQNGGFVGTSASGSGDAGSIAISAGTLRLDNGLIDSSTLATGNGGDVSLTVDGPMLISGTSLIQSSTIGGTGKGGSVQINAGSLQMTGTGAIDTDTFGLGDAGSVTISVRGAATIVGASISSSADPGSTGDAGTVRVNAGSLSLNDVVIRTESLGTGNAGGVLVSSLGPVVLTDSDITSLAGATAGHAGTIAVNAGSLALDNSVITTETDGAGNGGDVSIAVGGGLTMVNASGILSSAEGTDPGSGNAGVITISAGSLSIEASVVASATFGPGSAGTISINAGTLALSGESAIDTDTFASGKAGQLTVQAGPISLVQGSAIESATGGSGKAGDVTVTATTLSVDGRVDQTNSNIFTGGGLGSSGDAGRVQVNATSISLTNLGEISSSALGTGNAGEVTIGTGSLAISIGGQIASFTQGPGAGGSIGIVAVGDVLLSGPGPQISAVSTGSGNAGSITVKAANLQLLDGASISTEALNANGGNITLNVGGLLYLLGSKITTSVDGAKGNGGNILIDPQFVVLNGSDIIAQAVGGNGGNILIDAVDFIPSADSLVSASSTLGVPGTVDIEGIQTALDKSLVVLSSDLRGNSQLGRDKCAAATCSTLVDVGRGGLPQDPDATIPALYLAGRGFAVQPRPRAAAALGGTMSLASGVAMTIGCH